MHQLAAINHPFISRGKTLAWPLLFFFLLSILQSRFLNKTTILLFILYLVITNYKEIIFISVRSLKAYGLLLLLAWEIASISWSKAPMTSLINVGNDIEILLFSLYSAYQARNKDVAGTLKLAAIIVITVVIAYCIIFPGASMSPYGLTSFYNHKNNLGFAIGVCSVILVMVFDNKLSNYVFLILSICLLMLSQSKTSINLLIFVCVLVAFLEGVRRSYHHLTPFTQGLVNILMKTIPSLLYILIAMLVLFRESITDYLIATIPYDALTGRGLLWITVLTRTRDDLLTGLGPGVFWGADRMSEIVQTTLYEQSWIKELHAADGGYIDVIGGIGFVGLALLLLSIVQAYRLLYQAKINSMHTYRLIFSFITYFILHNITESDAFRFVDAPWFMLQFLTFYLILKQPKLQLSKAMDSGHSNG